MAFELRVHFAGLCAYVTDPTDGKLGVLMPDCRNGIASKHHDDNTDGVHHAAYMRVDLGSLSTGYPGGEAADGPTYEVVHRLDGEQVEISPLPLGAVVGTPNVPKVTGWFDDTQLKPGLFAAVRKEVVMRTVLTGGEIRADYGNRDWEVAGTLAHDGRAQTGFFAGEIRWRTTINDDSVTVTLRKLSDNSTVDLVLRPVRTPSGDAVTVKLANLCALNPLEWDQLETSLTTRDVDFKWLYRLFDDTSRTASWAKRLAGKEFPYPLQRGTNTRGDEDCTGIAVVAHF